MGPQNQTKFLGNLKLNFCLPECLRSDKERRGRVPIRPAMGQDNLLLKVCLSNLPKNVAQNAPQKGNKQTNFQ